MGIANDCYNPKALRPNDHPLMSVGQWQLLQLYLIDAMNLQPGSMPYTDVAKIYTALKKQAIAFHSGPLSAAQQLGNKLYNYGVAASGSFRGVVKMMDCKTPDKDGILELLSNLESQALTFQTDSNLIFTQVSDYVAATQDQVKALNDAVAREIQKIAEDKAQIEKLTNSYNSSFADKAAAQAEIVHDKKVINDTKYYSWIPFVGTAVGVGEIISKENDIKKQVDRIKADVLAMQSDQKKIQAFNQEIAQLNYTKQYNQHMASEINDTVGSLQTIEGAWKTIGSELGDIVENVKEASASELKDEPCLAAVALTTAAEEWLDVANDARAFENNFYIQPNVALDSSS